MHSAYTFAGSCITEIVVKTRYWYTENLKSMKENKANVANESKTNASCQQNPIKLEVPKSFVTTVTPVLKNNLELRF